MNTIQKRNTKRLIAALRSGTYQQNRGSLRSGTSDTSYQYCIHGVACELSGLGKWENGYLHDHPFCITNEDGGVESYQISMPSQVRQHYGLSYEDINLLMRGNDSLGYTFEDLADYLDYILRSES